MGTRTNRELEINVTLSAEPTWGGFPATGCWRSDSKSLQNPSDLVLNLPCGGQLRIKRKSRSRWTLVQIENGRREDATDHRTRWDALYEGTMIYAAECAFVESCAD